MNAEHNDLRFSGAEFGSLRQVLSDDPSAVDLLKNHELRTNGDTIVRLTKAESEQLRELLTVRLATVGFKADYSLSEQGRILEDLIDRLFVP